MAKPIVDIKTRFWSKVNKTRGADACWEWSGAKDKNGYGQVRIDGSVQAAHRVSWEIHSGSAAGELCVCHACDNPSCINPAHLFLGTLGDNNRDKLEKGRQYQGESHHNAKLTNDECSMIRKMYADGTYSQSKIANQFGVTQSNVSYVVLRKSRKASR
jgi:predicted XRE-type DNA-binding protein